MGTRLKPTRRRIARLPYQTHHGLFTSSARRLARKQQQQRSNLPVAVITGGLLIWWLYPSDDFAQLSGAGPIKRKKIDGEGGNDEDGSNIEQNA